VIAKPSKEINAVLLFLFFFKIIKEGREPTQRVGIEFS